MLPKRRRARVGTPDTAPSSAARFPGVTVYLAEPRMGRMAGLGKGSGPHFLFFPPPSSEVTHVMMEGTSAEEAVCQQERRTAALHPGCTCPVLLDVSWFTESMVAGQPVPVECRHCLEELLERGVCEEVERVRLSERYQAMKWGSGTRVPPSCSSSPGPALVFQKSPGRGSEWLA
uniref:DNA polymerase mu n=1 Tax=Monodon monoceros TaxID=40151 RepID=A0A8C6BIG8_MONMO